MTHDSTPVPTMVYVCTRQELWSPDEEVLATRTRLREEKFASATTNHLVASVLGKEHLGDTRVVHTILNCVDAGPRDVILEVGYGAFPSLPILAAAVTEMSVMALQPRSQKDFAMILDNAIGSSREDGEDELADNEGEGEVDEVIDYTADIKEWDEENRLRAECTLVRDDLGLPPIYFSTQPLLALTVREADSNTLPTTLFVIVGVNSLYEEIAMYIVMKVRLLSNVHTIAFLVTLRDTSSKDANKDDVERYDKAFSITLFVVGVTVHVICYQLRKYHSVHTKWRLGTYQGEGRTVQMEGAGALYDD